MITLGIGTVVLCGALLALLVGGAGWALFVGLKAQGEGSAMIGAAREAELVRQSAPALAMVVRSDGRIEMPDRMADWLGHVTPPRFLADLAAPDRGITQEDAAALARDIGAAQRSGRAFKRALRPIGSDRAITLRGHRAPGEMGAGGTVLVWAFDATESEAEIARLTGESARLGQAHDALSGLIEAAPLPMWYRGSDLNLAMVNTAYVAAVEGRDAADVVARGIELIDGSGAEGGPLAGAARARDTRQPQRRIVHATLNGDRRSLEVHDVPLPNTGVAGFAVDVEDLEQSRAGAKRFADAQRAMLDRLSAGVAQFGADHSLVFCNQPFRRMFAMRSEWLSDRPEFDRVLERMREAGRLPEVRDFPGWKAERREWFLPREEASEENWHLSGGTHLRVVGQPLPDGGLLLIFEDRTEQVQLASARDTLLRVRTATFDNLFEALAVFATDGKLQLWNNRMRSVWGFEEEFLAAHPRVDTFADAAAPKLATPDRATLIPELVRSATLERQQRSGQVAFADGRHFEFAAVPLPDGNALLTMLDITDNQRVERALRDRADALETADKVKTQFVANMSYELRTPLTSIGGFAEMLHGGYAGKMTKQADSYVEAILESVERLGLLVDDVLDLTRGDGADAELVRDDVDLAAIARAAADTLRPAASRRKLDFAIETARSTGRVTGDPTRLQEAIEHLLRHAVAATPEGGRVLLHTDGSATQARVVVSDNGNGMDADSAATAFDRFAEPGMQPTGERALGLGLPLAKQFIEAHGGTIALLSEPGEGTLVTIELPRR
ncbi:MAG: PAS-domain containing protein [Sphingomonas bacterium]|nr:PAS-domain containing protein [Sphingomonas bacterium]